MAGMEKRKTKGAAARTFFIRTTEQAYNDLGSAGRVLRLGRGTMARIAIAAFFRDATPEQIRAKVAEGRAEAEEEIARGTISAEDRAMVERAAEQAKEPRSKMIGFRLEAGDRERLDTYGAIQKPPADPSTVAARIVTHFAEGIREYGAGRWRDRFAGAVLRRAWKEALGRPDAEDSGPDSGPHAAGGGPDSGPGTDAASGQDGTAEAAASGPDGTAGDTGNSEERPTA